MSDICRPPKKPLSVYRVWYLLLPVLLLFIFVEAVFVFMYMPNALGSAKDITGKLPYLPPTVFKMPS